eukprot:CAMPEP_0184643376 /NCGR_PEP_ID=MMETSP0308-20130426/210_1 /TAXON_ID=38269 /ORGANISM="Gloeochaete witrockiana, Strain SAG 46.84" /LENGTH=342 /DNA_ID=CAMNT_0027071269 /DNA_START=101 /DNA_END=1129 /DNA_ORIENTATION=-
MAVLVVLLSLGADGAATPTRKFTLRPRTPTKKLTLRPATPTKKFTLRASLKPTLKPSPKPSVGPAYPEVLIAYLTPFFVVPPVPFTGLNPPSGIAYVAIVPGGRFPAAISFSGLSSNPTAIIVQSGYPGSNGPFVLGVDITGAPTRFNASTVLPLFNAAQIALLRSSNLYVTVCTTKYPNGELRGQIVPPEKTFITQAAIVGAPTVQALGFGVGVLVGNTFTVGGYFYEAATVQITSSRLQYGATTIATIPVGPKTQLFPYRTAYFGPKSLLLSAGQFLVLNAGLLKLELSTQTIPNIISGGLQPLGSFVGAASTKSFLAHAHALLHAHKAMTSNHVLAEAN